MRGARRLLRVVISNPARTFACRARRICRAGVVRGVNVVRRVRVIARPVVSLRADPYRPPQRGQRPDPLERREKVRVERFGLAVDDRGGFLERPSHRM